MATSAASPAHVLVDTLRQTKNRLIGNPLAKAALTPADVDQIVRCIDAEPDDLFRGQTYDTVTVRQEAAHVVSALSFGSSIALHHLIKFNAHVRLLSAMSILEDSHPASLKLALVRALKSLSAAIADAAGPPQWGIGQAASPDHDDEVAALDIIFQLESLDIILPFLVDKSIQTRIAISQMLSASLRREHHRREVRNWSPPGERPKDTVGKRGWEKPEVTLSGASSRQGGWVSRNLVAELRSRDMKAQEAALSALASLSRDNRHLCFALSNPVNDGDVSPLASILSLTQSRDPHVQLAACLWYTAMQLALWLSSNGEHPSTLSLIYTLNRMIGSPSESLDFRAKACFILYRLCTDDATICRLAYADGCFDKLAELALATAPPEGVPSWDEDESESLSRLREATLTAIATLSLFENNIREQVMNKPRIVSIIKMSLSHRHVGVRWAACQCVRAFARAVSAVRTNVVDSGLGLSTFDVFMNQAEDRRVTVAASAAVSNLVNSHSPLKPLLVENGLIPRLVQLAHIQDQEIQLNALWAFKNLIHRSTPPLKKLIMEALSYEYMTLLLSDSNPAIQEQTVHIIQNFATDPSSVEAIFANFGADTLLDKLQEVSDSRNEHVLRQTMCLLANISNAGDFYRIHLLSRQQIVTSICAHLQHPVAAVRRPAAACIAQLAEVRPRKHCAQLHSAGVENTLRQICGGVGVHGHGIIGSPAGTGGTQMGVEVDSEVREKAHHALRLLESSHYEQEA